MLRILLYSLILLLITTVAYSSFALDKSIGIDKKVTPAYGAIKHVYQLQIVRNCEAPQGPYGMFHFLIEIDGAIRAGFNECTGLENITNTTEYRDGSYFNGEKLEAKDFQSEQNYHKTIVTLTNGAADLKFDINDANIKLIIIDKSKETNKQTASKYVKNTQLLEEIKLLPDTITITDCLQQ